MLLYCGEKPASEPAAQECIISTRVDEVALEAYGTAGSVTDLTNVCGDTAAHSQLNTRGFKPHRSFMLKGMRMALKPSACIWVYTIQGMSGPAAEPAMQHALPA